MRRWFVRCGFVICVLVSGTSALAEAERPWLPTSNDPLLDALLAETEDQWLPTIDDPLIEADLVARVRIDSHHERTIEHEGKKSTCGVAYRAEILESLKGPSEGFVTFGMLQRIEGGEEGEFLVVGSRRSDAVLRGEIPIIPGDSEESRREALCAARGAEYAVPPWPRCLIPFGTKGTPDTTGKWLDWATGDCCVENLRTVNAQRRTGIEGDRWWIPWEDLKREMRKQIEQAR